MTFRSETGWRLLRGGSWGDHPGDCRSACRDHDQPDCASNNVGFRVVCLAQSDHPIPLKDHHG